MPETRWHENITKVTEIHSLYKLRAISFKQDQVIEVFVPKPRFHVGDLRRHILKQLGVSFKSTTKIFHVIQDPSNTTR